MDLLYAREIGLGRYLWRTLLYKLKTRVLRRDMEKTLPTGVRMTLPRDRAHSAEIYGTNCRVDWGAEMLLAEYLGQSGDKAALDFIDVGANIGFYSLLMSPLVREVHAFEPDPRNLGPLRFNAARAGNVRVIAKAAAAVSETRFFDVSAEPELNRLAPGGAAAPGRLQVETVTLDSFRAALPPAAVRVAAVKIDVEGFECEVLEGAHELTRRDRPVFLIEFLQAPDVSNTPARLDAFLQAHDYFVCAVVRDAAFARTRFAELRRLEIAEISDVRAKMLFLVPRDERFFSDRIGQRNTDGSA